MLRFTKLRKLLNQRSRRKSLESAYNINSEIGEVSKEAQMSAHRIRGKDRQPAIIIHGVMPRSGTVFVGELLRKHPVVEAYPNNLWEIPFLECVPRLLDYRTEFFKGYVQNQKQMALNDLLPLCGASFLSYLHDFCPSGKRLLLKESGVKYIHYFPTVFPKENLLLLIRDGRDLVHSTLKTWPKMRFTDVCKQWAMSTQALLGFYDKIKVRDGYWMARFEDAVRDPDEFVRKACNEFRLDVDDFPFQLKQVLGLMSQKLSEVKVIGSSTISGSEKVDWSKPKKPPTNFKPVQHWSNWTATQKRRFKRIAGDVLIEAGYADDNFW